tara:strand:+ start:234 stop:572 length:339 start_codon:yes stop_codon:yes gene_type:complete
MAAGKYNISIDQGSDYAIDITITEAGAPRDLTGYSARSQLRASTESTVVAAVFTCTIAAPTTGVINISMTNAISSSLTSNSYVYDVELYTTNDAFVQRILYGNVKVSPEVTR